MRQISWPGCLKVTCTPEVPDGFALIVCKPDTVGGYPYSAVEEDMNNTTVMSVESIVAGVEAMKADYCQQQSTLDVVKRRA